MADDYVDMLVNALGGGWYASCDPSRWRRWSLARDGVEYCCRRRRGDLLKAFADRSALPASSFGVTPACWRNMFPVPEFLRCGSAQELKLRLELLAAEGGAP